MCSPTAWNFGEILLTQFLYWGSPVFTRGSSDFRVSLTYFWTGGGWLCTSVRTFSIFCCLYGPIFVVSCCTSVELLMVVPVSLLLILVHRWKIIEDFFGFVYSCLRCFLSSSFLWFILHLPNYGVKVFYDILLQLFM